MNELNEFVCSLDGLISLYNRIDELDPLRPASEQLLQLGDDMFQVEFADGSVVDVGFHPWSPDGRFIISVISGGDWDNPVRQLECKEFTELFSLLKATLIDVGAQVKSMNSG